MSNTSNFPLPFPDDGNSAPESEFVGCEAAEEYYDWVSVHLTEIDDADLVDINQKIILVTTRYHDWYNRVPEKHRVRVGRRGHECIFHVFMMALDVLIEAKTKLNPPLYIPSPPPPPLPVLFEDQPTLLGLKVEPEEPWAE